MTRQLTEDSGIALPTVLIALVALSALALAMTVSSRSNIVVSALEEKSMEALQGGDGALNYALAIPANFADTVSQPLVDMRSVGQPFDGNVKVDYEPPPKLPPAGIHVSALKIAFYYFLLNSQGIVKSGVTGRPDSTVQLQMEATKLGPASS